MLGCSPVGLEERGLAAKSLGVNSTYNGLDDGLNPWLIWLQTFSPNSLKQAAAWTD